MPAYDFYDLRMGNQNCFLRESKSIIGSEVQEFSPNFAINIHCEVVIAK
jgi:hypothetical protein